MNTKLSKIQVDKIKSSFLLKPYSYLFYIWILLFILFNLYINEVYIIGFRIFTYGFLIYLPFIFFLFLNSILVSVNINLLIIKYKELNSISSEGSFFSVIGTFFAMLAGACPGCVAGFFPIVLGLFGSTLTLNSLPLKGIELQIISSILLLVGTYYMSKDLSCKVNFNKKK